MGRKNFDSIGKPLPGRQNIVVTRSPALQLPGCTVVHSIEEAFTAANSAGEIFVIGGAELYRQTLARATRMYLTLVHATVDGDTFFPDVEPREWREVARERHEADAEHRFAYSFVTLERST
jgi:dihydrofolate reductase